MSGSQTARLLARSLYTLSSRSINYTSRNAHRNLRGARSRYFSDSSVVCANLTRPTTRTATTTSASTAYKPATSKPAAPAKPESPAQSTSQSQSTPTSPSTTTSPSNITSASNQRSLSSGLNDLPPPSTEGPIPDPQPVASNDSPVDWSRSFHGLSSTPFSDRAANALLAPINPEDVEIKPDGIVYLPEIKYRRILNKAFGPGGWGLAPRGETIVTAKSVTREYGLVAHGRLVSIARGEQQYFDPEGIPTATEGCKSNALMRCCKDLGIASELWDPVFIRKFKAGHAKEVWVEQLSTKRKKKIFMRKDVDVAPGGFKFS